MAVILDGDLDNVITDLLRLETDRRAWEVKHEQDLQRMQQEVGEFLLTR